MTTLTTLDILKKGRELIADPARWTQYVLARTDEGLEVEPTSQQAYCFCTIGAVDQVAKGREGLGAIALMRLARQMDFMVADFNDERTHAEVLAAWDRAIAAEEAKQ